MGIWAISKILDQPVVNELLFNDVTNIRESALYKLSQMRQLSWFKNILLCGSYPDNYSPLESSLIQFSDRIEETTNFKIIKEMWEAINEWLSSVNVYKTCVNLKIEEKSIDTIIGRKTHIEYLENTDLLKFLVWHYDEVFSKIE